MHFLSLSLLLQGRPCEDHDVHQPLSVCSRGVRCLLWKLLHVYSSSLPPRHGEFICVLCPASVNGVEWGHNEVTTNADDNTNVINTCTVWNKGGALLSAGKQTCSFRFIVVVFLQNIVHVLSECRRVLLLDTSQPSQHSNQSKMSSPAVYNKNVQWLCFCPLLCWVCKVIFWLCERGSIAVLRVLITILCDLTCREKWDLFWPSGLPMADFLKLFNAAFFVKDNIQRMWSSSAPSQHLSLLR